MPLVAFWPRNGLKWTKSGVDLAIDLAPDLAVDLATDLVPDLATDLVPDLVVDLAPDLVTDLVPDLVSYFAIHVSHLLLCNLT